MKKLKQATSRITVTVKDGTLEMSTAIYVQLNKAINNLTGLTTIEVLQAINELLTKSI